MIGINSKIYIAGHQGLVGSAIYRKLKLRGYKNLIVKTRRQLDLNNQNKVLNFLKKTKPILIKLNLFFIFLIYKTILYIQLT